MLDRVSASLLKLPARFALLSAVAAAPAIALPAQSQSQAQPSGSAEPFSYEVVLIKPHQSGGNESSWWRMLPDGFAASGITIDDLIRTAYRLTMADQLSGLPGWAHSERFDVQAKMDEDTVAALKKLTPKERDEQHSRMMQALLADRFQLKVRHETRELPIYDLVIAKGGLKIKESPVNETGRMWFGRGKITVQATPIEGLAVDLSNTVGRLIVDKTGLTGKYDIDLKWTPAELQETADSGPSIFAALEEQLGLKLVPAKGPVDTIVVDRVEKPSPN